MFEKKKLTRVRAVWLVNTSTERRGNNNKTREIRNAFGRFVLRLEKSDVRPTTTDQPKKYAINVFRNVYGGGNFGDINCSFAPPPHQSGDERVAQKSVNPRVVVVVNN